MRYLLPLLLAACSYASPTGNDAAARPEAGRGAQQPTMNRIFEDKTIWGPDFPVLLAHLQSLERAKQQQVLVFPDRAVVASPAKTEDEAKKLADTLNTQISELQKNPTPLFKRMSARSPAARPLRATVERLPEDQSFRASIPGLNLLQANLTVATVRKQLGAPENVTRQLIEGPGDSRPLVLTLYRYAGGSVVFAEADIAPRPGFVNRAVLNVPAVTAALAKEGK
jgi:hypothetical protein